MIMAEYTIKDALQHQIDKRLDAIEHRIGAIPPYKDVDAWPEDCQALLTEAWEVAEDAARYL